MKIRMKNTGEIRDYDKSYALRLICDGQAESAEGEPETAAPAAETKPAREAEKPAKAAVKTKRK